jgi:hypothetical protein
MVSAKIRRLRDTFEAWSIGRPFPTIEAWFEFRRELKEITFEVAMLELGVDLNVVDVAVELAKPHSNVVFLQPRAERGVKGQGNDSGGAS